MFTVHKGFRLWGSVKTPQHWSCQKDTVKGSVISYFTCFAGKQTETAENILCSLGEGGRGGDTEAWGRETSSVDEDKVVLPNLSLRVIVSKTY